MKTVNELTEKGERIHMLLDKANDLAPHIKEEYSRNAIKCIAKALELLLNDDPCWVKEEVK